MTVSRIPGIPYGPLPRVASVSGALSWPPRLVVIHDTSNTATAQAEATYAASRTDGQSLWTSCHAYIDTAGPLGSTPLDTVAWAAFSYANHNGWHIEMCGMNAGQPGAVPAVTVVHTARLVAQLCDLAGIPKVKLTPAQVAAGARGICGHYDITLGLGVGDHDDPGPAFNWAGFMALVQQGVTDMNLSDPVPGTATAAHPGDRLVSDVLGDAARLRAVLYGEAPAAPGTPLATLVGLPAQLAAVALDAKAAASLPPVVTMTPEDQTAIIAGVVAGLAPLIPTAEQNAIATLDEQHRRDAA